MLLLRLHCVHVMLEIARPTSFRRQQEYVRDYRESYQLQSSSYENKKPSSIYHTPAIERPYFRTHQSFYQFQEIDQRPAPSMMKYGFSLNGLCGCGCSPISKLTLVSPTLVSFDSSLQAGDVTACGLLFGHMPSLLTPAAFDRICEASLPRKKR